MKSLPLLSFILLVATATGCQNARNEAAPVAVAPETSEVAADAAAANKSATDTVKLVKTAGLRLQVHHVDRTTRELSAMVREAGGMLTHQQLTYQTVQSREVRLSDDSVLRVTAIEPQAHLQVRVPAHQLENFLFRATDLSLYPMSRVLDIDDQSLAYLENAWKAQNRSAVLNRPDGNKGFSRDDRVSMGDDAIDRTLANRRIDADVRYSTVDLELYQHPVLRKETLANTDLAAFRQPAGRRFVNALAGGGQVFADVFFALLHLWPFLLLSGLGLLLYRRYRRRGAVG